VDQIPAWNGKEVKGVGTNGDEPGAGVLVLGVLASRSDRWDRSGNINC